MMNRTYLKNFARATLIACCALSAHAQTVDAKFDAMLKEGFRAEGIAGLDRLQQDQIQALCSDPELRQTPAAQKILIEEQSKALAAIKPPSDGQYLGSWKAGEAVAQSGRGATWSDTTKSPNGGGCYNCHQISKEEISFGTIGPSLYNYGKIRGVSDPRSAEAKAKLSACVAPGNQGKVMEAPVTAIIGMDLAFHEQLPALFPHTDARAWFVGNPALIESTAFRNSSLQGAYLMMAARALARRLRPMMLSASTPPEKAMAA